jgi:hypothetical protein
MLESVAAGHPSRDGAFQHGSEAELEGANEAADSLGPVLKWTSLERTSLLLTEDWEPALSPPGQVAALLFAPPAPPLPELPPVDAVDEPLRLLPPRSAHATHGRAPRKRQVLLFVDNSNVWVEGNHRKKEEQTQRETGVALRENKRCWREGTEGVEEGYNTNTSVHWLPSSLFLLIRRPTFLVSCWRPCSVDGLYVCSHRGICMPFVLCFYFLGQKLAALKQGMLHKDVDLRFRLHMDGLIQLALRVVAQDAGCEAMVANAFLYGSPSTSDSVWQEARNFNFQVQVYAAVVVLLV